MIHLLFAGAEAESEFAERPGFKSVAKFARYGAGFFRCAAETYCILPRPFQQGTPPGAHPLGDISLLLRALRRYARLRERTTNVTDWPSEGVAIHSNAPHWAARIEAAVSLLSDYMTRGAWRRETVKCSPRPTGNIHWPRTLHTSTPMLSRAGVVYDPLLRSQRVQDSSDPLWLVWADCLRQSANFLGLDPHGLHLPSVTQPGASVARATCRDHGSRVFDDRSRMLVGCMRTLLDAQGVETTSTDANVQWLRIDHEEHLWEAVTRNALTGADLADCAAALPPMPSGRWLSGGAWSKESGPHFDCRMTLEHEREQWLLVADAKRYDLDAEITGADLYKQWLYAFFSSDSYDSRGYAQDRIANIFVMPSGEPGAANGTGLYAFTTPGDRNGAFGTVMRFELDYRRALDFFLSGRRWPDLANRVLEEWVRLRDDARGHPFA